jgi:hypothetical protein
VGPPNKVPKRGFSIRGKFFEKTRVKNKGFSNNRNNISNTRTTSPTTELIEINNFPTTEQTSPTPPTTEIFFQKW